MSDFLFEPIATSERSQRSLLAAPPGLNQLLSVIVDELLISFLLSFINCCYIPVLLTHQLSLVGLEALELLHEIQLLVLARDVV